MMNLIADGLTIIIAAGWLYLLLVGPEMDRALSGGIPGHHKDHSKEIETPNTFMEKVCWVLFIVVMIALPLIVWWSVRTFA